MPNHIKNRLELNGDPKLVSEFIDTFKTDYPETPHRNYENKLTYKNEGGSYGWLDESTGLFYMRDADPVQGVPEGYSQHFDEAWTRFPDFNKIVEMPESLYIDSDGFVMPLENEFSRNDSFYRTVEKLRNLPEDRRLKTLENMIQGIRNFVEYGHATWYGWAKENWGTKWNAYSCKQESDNVFTFETAWKGVPELIKKMAERFPGVAVLYEFADEDTGSNTGVLTFHNGETTEVYHSGNKEAYELAFKLRPDRREDYELVDGEYKYKSEENE